jgi:hypothetical protein
MDESTYKDRGVAMLHLKAVDNDAQKLQLLVRAQTATGVCERAYTTHRLCSSLQASCY